MNARHMRLSSQLLFLSLSTMKNNICILLFVSLLAIISCQKGQELYEGFVFPCGAFKDGMMMLKGVTPDNIRDKSLKEIYQSSEYIKTLRIE